ncbi:MAG: hypothetical protein J0H25_09680 [Rhizobiales bacterium]|nr:hypothetical protein [Hyphomicrobiales bacterium]
MTAQPLTALLDDLDRIAHDASINAENYRKEAAVRFRELEQDRAFGFRRLNLMRTVTAALDGCETEEDAILRGSTAFLHELGWSGTSETQQETLTNFAPVIAACWQAMQPEAPETGTPADSASIIEKLRAFEAWFAEHRNGAFLSIMEREIVELPLVETC